jgi:hypothetical protein
MVVLFSLSELFVSIQTTMNDISQQLLNMVMPIFEGFAPYIQAAILIGLALLSVIGIIVIVKKYIKFFVALGILAGIGAAFYFFVLNK